MTSKRPQNADALAEALRGSTATDEDLVRIERGLVRALRERRTSSSAPRWWMLATVSAVAVAMAWLWFAPSPPPTEIVRVPLPLPPPSVAPPELAVLHAGNALAADHARLANAELTVPDGSLVEVDDDAIAHAEIRLVRGEVHVAFHPHERGAEHLAVITDLARVEVVGTEFDVVRTETSTSVRVVEGVVRVIEIATGAVREVRHGEHAEVSAPAIAPRTTTTSTTPRPAATTIETPPTLDDLEALADEQRLASPSAAIVTETRILALDPHGDRGATALFDRADIEERELHDASRAASDYAQYLADYPSGAFREQARARLCALDSSRCE
jgi:hypothetical protein